MTKLAQSLTHQILALPPVDRASMIEELFSSFDPAGRQAIDKVWAEEVESRIDDFNAGLLKARPLASILRQVNKR